MGLNPRGKLRVLRGDPPRGDAWGSVTRRMRACMCHHHDATLGLMQGSHRFLRSPPRHDALTGTTPGHQPDLDVPGVPCESSSLLRPRARLEMLLRKDCRRRRPACRSRRSRQLRCSPSKALSSWKRPHCEWMGGTLLLIVTMRQGRGTTSPPLLPCTCWQKRLSTPRKGTDSDRMCTSHTLYLCGRNVAEVPFGGVPVRCIFHN